MSCVVPPAAKTAMGFAPGPITDGHIMRVTAADAANWVSAMGGRVPEPLAPVALDDVLLFVSVLDHLEGYREVDAVEEAQAFFEEALEVAGVFDFDSDRAAFPRYSS